GPNAAAQGIHVVATNLIGDYSPSTLSSLQTPVLDLTAVTDPALQFQHWFQSEIGTISLWDGGNIKISTDGGATYSELVPGSIVPAYTGALATANPMGGQQGYSGDVSITGYTLVTVDLEANLPAAPRDQVRLRFDFGADGTVFRPGWYIDAVVV